MPSESVVDSMYACQTYSIDEGGRIRAGAGAHATLGTSDSVGLPSLPSTSPTYHA
jgi:hypothetical protein